MSNTRESKYTKSREKKRDLLNTETTTNREIYLPILAEGLAQDLVAVRSNLTNIRSLGRFISVLFKLYFDFVNFYLYLFTFSRFSWSSRIFRI